MLLDPEAMFSLFDTSFVPLQLRLVNKRQGLRREFNLSLAKIQSLHSVLFQIHIA